MTLSIAGGTRLSTVTNGNCPKIAQRIWIASNPCGSVTCTQKVTMVDTTSPMIICVGNKIVQCGTAWTFDQPTAYDNCCTNVTVTLLSSNIVQSLPPCTFVYRGIWQAVDCCNNSP